MQLLKLLEAWNGKDLSVLERVYRANSGDGAFLAELVARLGSETSEEHQVAVTWLIKKSLELGAKMKAAEVGLLLACLPRLGAWGAVLHVLQCLPHLAISARARPAVESFLRDSLDSDNKLVRAWAYNGFHVLSLQYPQYRGEAKRLLAKGLKDNAASVKARIRRILAGG